MTDEKRVEDLEKRIDELESRVRSTFPSRRDALKLGVAGVAGAAAMSGTASAGSAQVGTIGDGSNLVDVHAEDIFDVDTINGASVSSAAAGEALTSDGAGGLTFASVGGGIPANFTYNIVTSSRSLDTVFTNNTGKALFVHVSTDVTESGRVRASLDINIGNTRIAEYGIRDNADDVPINARPHATFFVPNGSDYEVGTSGAAQQVLVWAEAEM